MSEVISKWIIWVCGARVRLSRGEIQIAISTSPQSKIEACWEGLSNLKA